MKYLLHGITHSYAYHALAAQSASVTGRNPKVQDKTRQEESKEELEISTVPCTAANVICRKIAFFTTFFCEFHHDKFVQSSRTF